MGSSTKSRKPIVIGSGFVTAAVIAFALFSVLMTSHHVDESERAFGTCHDKEMIHWITR